MDGSIHYGHYRKEYFRSPISRTTGRNRLLAALPAEVYECLAPDLEGVRLELRWGSS